MPRARGIQVDRDARGAPFASSPLLLDHRVGQHVRHVAQHWPPHGVLEPRQRGLRGQRRPGERVALHR